MRTALFALLLAFLLGATEASAQTTPTFGEKAVGSTDCKNGAFAADFDTLAQCTSTSSTTGTMQKAPIFVGAVTSPPYPSTTCDSSKAGMMQYTASAMQYCNGTAWTSFGATASGTNAQSMVAGWPDVIVCSNGTYTRMLYFSEHTNTNQVLYRLVYYGGDFRVLFNKDTGTYNSHANIADHDCVTNAWSIAQLVANGKAFNLANGGGGANEMQDGTAGAPGLYFSADPNTGFYRPAADTVAIATAGVERFRINAAGNIGLGASDPTTGSNLDLSSKTDSVLLPKGTDAQRPTGVAGMIRYNTTSNSFEVYQGSTPAWVAMGTGSGTSTLGASTATASPYRSGEANTGLFSRATGEINFTSLGTEVVRVAANGAVTLGSSAATAGTILDMSAGTGTTKSSILLPKDTTANRPATGVEGMIRYNTTTKGFEGYQGSTPAWGPLGGGAPIAIRVFSTAGSHTYTPTAGATTAVVEVVGGGGGGASDNGPAVYGGNGGGGGGYAKKRISLSGVSSVAVTVGAGGTAGTGTCAAGGAGGTTSFGAYVSASGGGGGLCNSGTMAVMGTGSGGDINLAGGVNYSGTMRADAEGAHGMPAPFSGSVGGSQGALGTVGSAGVYGGGGGGSYPGSYYQQNGGPGGAGIVIVTEYAATGGAAGGTADTLTNPRDFSITGDATAPAVSFNGSANVALNATVGKIQGRTVASTAPTDGQILAWNTASSEWRPVSPAAAGANAQSMFAGWPDVIVCSNIAFYAVNMPYPGPDYRYRAIYNTLADVSIYYNADGTYKTNAASSGTDCVTNSWTIAQLIANGRAFNLANGQAGGTAEMQDGTAGAPGLYFSADPNTGFYRPAADTLAIATNGSEKVRINASGQVALNSITPTAGAILDLAAGTGTALSSMIVPKDTTANRPTTGVEGMLRYNTTTKAFEGYQGSTPTWSQMAKAAESLTTSTATASWTLNPGSYGSVTGGVSDIIDTSTDTTMVLRTDVSTIDWLGGTSATTFAGPSSSSCAVYKLDFGDGARGRAYVSVTVDPEQTSGNICSGWWVGTVFAIYSTDTSYTSGCTFANGSQVVNFAVLYNGCGDPAAVTSTGGGFFFGRYLYLIAAGTRNSWEGNYMNGRGKATINVLDVRLE